ncbi:MAG: hypothetical protein KF889_25535 [Alphaproteobacteria bacterium]|nr:hypothetical protein [Alphaproteobacteria bacterium]MCW5739642.1 hypothetical protein [Alphaproteobacteria bacterium]
MTATPNVVQREKLKAWLDGDDRSVTWLTKKLRERLDRPISFWTVRRVVLGQRQPAPDEGRAIIAMANGAVTAADFYGIDQSADRDAA